MSQSLDDVLAGLTPSQLMLYHKQQEHAGLQALLEASKVLVERVERLGEMSNVMADGGEAIGQVMRNWPHVFSILNHFDRPPATSAAADTSRAGTASQDEPEPPLPQLVRLHYSGEQPGPAVSATTAASR